MAVAPPVPLHTITTPLTAADLIVQAAHLEDLQANIFKHHGRDNAAHVFLKFKAGEKAKAKTWIKDKLKPRLTTAKRQLDAAVAFREKHVDGGPLWSLLLSATGYKFLGYDVTKLDPVFQNGIQASIGKLNDPPLAEWETWAQGEIDAMILIADSQQANAQFTAMALSAEVHSFAKVLHIEIGHQQRNKRKNGIEHFGYVDGRSQPIMLESEMDEEKDGRFIFDPSAGPAQVLVSDPFGTPGASGSYFVFRKLEEHVRSFKVHEQELANALGLTGDDRELAGALVIGRFEDGTPVTLAKKPLIESSPVPNGKSVPNNFDYKLDSDGAKCPFHSHIRKSHPRGSSPGQLAFDQSKRMARRGITYGQRTDDGSNISSMPEDGVGLLFMAYQRNIADQFEFIQQSWVNTPLFPTIPPTPQHPATVGTGIDPVIGQHAGASAPVQQWPKSWGQMPVVPVAFSFADFVVMKGGAYFFSPSLSSL
jgi:Dyp-type peroxidase family